VRYEETYRIEFSVKKKPEGWIMSRIVIVILIYNRHKPVGLVAET
jgi:hypothetical protein